MGMDQLNIYVSKSYPRKGTETLFRMPLACFFCWHDVSKHYPRKGAETFNPFVPVVEQFSFYNLAP